MTPLNKTLADMAVVAVVLVVARFFGVPVDGASFASAVAVAALYNAYKAQGSSQ